MKNLRHRLVVAAVGIPASIIVVYAGGIFLALGLGFLGAVGYWEYATMMRKIGHRPLMSVGALTTVALPLAVLDSGFPLAWVVAVVAIAVAATVATFRLPPPDRPISNASVTVFGALYIGALLSFGVPLREWFLPDRVEGTLLFFYPIVVTWSTDTGAYTGGKLLGSRQMSPTISPNKTVEGGLAGILTGAVAGLLYGLWVLPSAGGVARSLLFGMLIAILAILGDLVESALKRECGQKDSSALLPGHGGFLDRLDSLLWTIPGAFLFFTAAGL
ncbi:MAG: phosphatidate cytidylyltransferase [Gemmatimonadales bacterium]